MATNTPNINLVLPIGSEKVSRQIINDNNTKIDTAIGAVPPGNDLQSQVTALNNNITNLSDSIGTVPSGETVEGQISTLDDNKANYKEVDVSSYQYNQEAGAEALFSALPTTFFGVCHAKFTAGYKAICLVTKSGASYGSITYSVDYNKEPYYYAKNGNSVIFSQLALKSDLIKRLDVGNVSAGGSKTVAFPTGTTATNITIVRVNLSASGTIYTEAAIVEYLDSNGIHVKNNGGAGGTVYIDYCINQ